MAAVNRIRQQTLRRIQDHMGQAALRHGAEHIQTALMDVFQFHDTGFHKFNYTTPRKGVALVPLGEVEKALACASQPLRLSVIESLYPAKWFEQLQTIGLERRRGYPLLTYGIVPDCDQEEPPPTQSTVTPEETVTIRPASTPGQVEACLRLYGQPTIQDIRRSVRGLADYSEVYLVAQKNRMTVGSLLLTIVDDSAQLCCAGFHKSVEIDSIFTALVDSAVSIARERQCSLIFTVSEQPVLARLYRQSGFIDLDQVFNFRKSVRDEQSLAQSVS